MFWFLCFNLLFHFKLLRFYFFLNLKDNVIVILTTYIFRFIILNGKLLSYLSNPATQLFVMTSYILTQY